MPHETIKQTLDAAEALKKDPEAAGLSLTREVLLRKIREESGLRPEVFDEIVDNFQYDINKEKPSETIKFRVGGHEITYMMQVNNKSEIRVDGVVVSRDLSDRIWERYSRAFLSISNISTPEIANEKAVIDKKIEAEKENRLAKELGL